MLLRALTVLAATAGLGRAALVDTLLEIAPASKDCDAPPDSVTPDECRTAAQVAPLLEKAFEQYKVTSAAEQAVVVSNMVYESGSFKYKRQLQSQSNPLSFGQGTVNMQSAAFNNKYGKSIPAIADKIKALKIDDSSHESALKSSNETLIELLDILTVDEYNFGSGVWFMAEPWGGECDKVRTLIKTDAEAGFEAWLKSCVNAPKAAARTDLFKTALAAFEKAGSGSSTDGEEKASASSKPTSSAPAQEAAEETGSSSVPAASKCPAKPTAA